MDEPAGDSDTPPAAMDMAADTLESETSNWNEHPKPNQFLLETEGGYNDENMEEDHEEMPTGNIADVGDCLPEDGCEYEIGKRLLFTAVLASGKQVTQASIRENNPTTKDKAPDHSSDDPSEDQEDTQAPTAQLDESQDYHDIAGELARGELTYERMSAQGPPRVDLSLRIFMLQGHQSYIEVIFRIIYETDGVSSDHLSEDKAGFRLTSQHLDLDRPFEVREVVTSEKMADFKENELDTAGKVLVDAVPQSVSDNFPRFMHHVNTRQMFQVTINRAKELGGLYAWNLYKDDRIIKHGSQEKKVRRLASQLASSETLVFYVRGSEIMISLERLGKLLVDQAESPPWQAYMPKNRKAGTPIFIQAGKNQTMPRRERPKITPGANLSYASWEEYTIAFGMAAQQEHENEVVRDSCRQLRGCELRFVAIPYAGNRRYFALMDTREQIGMELNEDDQVKINMRADIDEYIPIDPNAGWSGRVVEQPPFVHPKFLVFLVTRPWDKQNARWLDEDLQIPAIDLSQQRSDKIHEILESARQKYVTISLVSSQKTYRQEIVSLDEIRQGNCSQHVKQILLANDFQSLPQVNLFKDLEHFPHDKILSMMEKAFEFDKQQMLFVRQCFGLPGGWGMLFGPPGTGKTFELIHLITPILANQRMISQDTDETPNRQILIVTSANEPATDIALKLWEHNKDKIGHLQRLPMVVRAHSRETEEAVARLWQQPKDKPRSPSSRPPIISQNILDGQSAEDIDMLDLISMSKVLLDTHSRATKTRFEGIKDPRFRAKDISVGAWMLRRLGLISDEPKEFQGFSHPEKYTDILNGFSLIANGESHATKEDREAFTKGIRELQYDIIRHADVVVTTLSNAGTEWIKLNANFDAIFLDEAGQAPEPQVWNALAVHKPRVFIQFGDPRQLPPFCKSSTVRENNFYLVLHTSLFARLERAGFLHVMLERQHRMHETICKLVSDLSYHGRMITVDSESNYLTSRRVSRFNRKYGKERTAIYLDVAGSKEELNSTKSKANLDHRKIVLELAASLLRENVVLGSQIAIITPYSYQRNMYRCDVSSMARAHPQIGQKLLDIVITTIDGFQGREREVCIVDLTCTERIGFLHAAQRINVALSRAKCGLYVVGNVRAMSEDRKYQGYRRPSLLNKLATQLGNDLAIVQVNPKGGSRQKRGRHPRREPNPNQGASTVEVGKFVDGNLEEDFDMEIQKW
ncbi:DNA helicase [Histoplasma capsulatum G186AR]|uniref:DNA helicase n=1 Tax=Ajellomyces capsulatus (strain G186AR / H82 / ATCC MYA-2454 / RMSCC 2432) TaxID=447093 RepID=C0NT29_AJECG|nr:DNA helicase [Histoplasma capsulatum G186AR]EEH05190.1 DNA helicase [Histoplasma capsulatum G186AR]